VSYATPRDQIDHRGYTDAVVREIELRARDDEFGRAALSTVFFGGGTPSLWDAPELGRVIAALRTRFDLAADAEITVECNPTSIDRDRALCLRDVGVNRLSIGAQSLDQKELEFLGRLHDMKGALDAIEGVASVSGLRVSADLIFGLPDQPPERARAHAARIADVGISHMSCYELTIEPGTRFGEMARRGRLPRAKDDAVIESFLAIDELLESRGFRHYEISNYAKPGNEARHNLGYWRGDAYVGLGCAAYGFMRERGDGVAVGHRYRNETRPEKYMQDASNGGREGDTERLDAETMLRERIMLGLRLASGFDAEAAAKDLGVAFWTNERTREAESLVAKGRLERVREDGGRDVVRIPKRAWLFANDTASRLF
jgi:oxygen-independent coproporphyrinogen-3 oxidase